ncbi:MAG: type IV pilin protein [Gemmatimonadota bacterium]
MHRLAANNRGFTLVEMLVVLAVLGILAAIAVVKLGASSDKAYVAAMRSDLHNVMVAEMAYAEESLAANRRNPYTTRINQLDVNLSNGVRVRLRANRTGWSGQATHTRLPGARCAVYQGTIRSFPPATREGSIACD